MKLNDQLLESTLGLARLKFDQSGIKALEQKLQTILDFVETLSEAKDGQNPKIAPLRFLVGRLDEALPPRWPLAAPPGLVKQSPVHRGQFVAVPQVFSKRS